MLQAKKPAEVIDDLEALLKPDSQTNLTFLDIDLDFFMHFYDIYGPEQERNALYAINNILSPTPGSSLFGSIDYKTLFAHHEDASESKIYLNHFFAASFGKKDPLDLGREIKNAIESAKIPLVDSSLKPRERKVEDEKIVIIDPSKITVHMGISRYAGFKPDVPALLSQAMAAEEKSKTEPSRILILP